jgi:hypothetical protein
MNCNLFMNYNCTKFHILLVITIKLTDKESCSMLTMLTLKILLYLKLHLFPSYNILHNIKTPYSKLC